MPNLDELLNVHCLFGYSVSTFFDRCLLGHMLDSRRDDRGRFIQNADSGSRERCIRPLNSTDVQRRDNGDGPTLHWVISPNKDLSRPHNYENETSVNSSGLLNPNWFRRTKRFASDFGLPFNSKDGIVCFGEVCRCYRSMLRTEKRIVGYLKPDC